LVGRRPRAEGVLPFERAILEAVGVPGSDIVLMDRPVRVDCLLAATPMFSYPQYVSPRIADTWGAVAGQVAARADDRATPRRIFVGRERASRLCTNAAAVERLFADFGFVTVYPEHFSFVDQVEMFRNAEVVAGYAGSALFTLCFCAPGKRVLMLSSESYTANNEYLIAAVLGHEIDVFWSAAAERRPNADFEFDFAREGRQLAAVLAGLGPPGDRASRRDSMTSGRAVRS
jgi:capsular polysaccharide biosynthesis protein